MRCERVLVVLDGLDEARADLYAIADLLRGRSRARVLLTSRPNAWKRQLTLANDNTRHKIGWLEPLSHPDDVLAVVRAWLTNRPDAAERLEALLEAQPHLARQVTNPLMCTMYCLLALRGEFPETQRELFGRVVHMLLAGTWRGEQPSDGEIGAAERSLVELAWEGAVDDPMSGLGRVR